MAPLIMYFWSFVAVPAFISVASAGPAPIHRYVLHQKRDSDKSWVKRDRVHRDTLLPMRIGMVQNNLSRGHDFLMDVSHPESPNYGKHMTAEQVIEFFAPPQHRVDAVHTWLSTAGIGMERVSQSDNKQWIQLDQLDLSVVEAEALLKTNYHYFEHVTTGKTSVACDEYHVHKDVAHHVDYITPGINLHASAAEIKRALKKRTLGAGGGTPPPTFGRPPFGVVHQNSVQAGTPLSYCSDQIQPECIRAMYNITEGTLKPAGNEMGVFEDLGEYYTQADLNPFFKNLYPRIPSGTHPTLKSIDGGPGVTTDISMAGSESNLDFQCAYPIVWPQNQILYDVDDKVYQADYPTSGIFNNLPDAIDGSYCDPAQETEDPAYPHKVTGGYNKKKQCGVFQPTHVISLSYGNAESSLTTAYVQRQCAEYMKLGMQGVTVVAASGDNGVAGASNGCLDGGKVFNPLFVVVCPYVLAVGATVLKPGGAAQKDEETATTGFGSGGGFSNYFGMPDYQQSAVSSYLSRYGNTYASYGTGAVGNGLYNNTGRGFPDVSAVGQNIFIYNRGDAVLSGGTSASTPIWGAIISRINAERLKIGKSTVGFINPVLYANPQVLHDITVGNNPGCNTTGFPAATGWDPVNGLGTPNYPSLLALFKGLA